LNWLGVTINPGVGDGVGLVVGRGVGLGVGVGLGEGCGEGVADDMGDGTCDGTCEGPPGGVCGVTRAAIFGERTEGKAKEDIEIIIATMTIDEIVTAIQRYLES